MLPFSVVSLIMRLASQASRQVRAISSILAPILVACILLYVGFVAYKLLNRALSKV